MCEFRRISRVRVRGLFGKTRVNSIDRGGRAQRGYNDLCLVSSRNASPGNDNGNGAPMKQCPTPVAESTADARPKDRGGDIQMSKDANGVTDAKDAGDKHSGNGAG